ncbi:MAG: hypothetical protein RLZZ241_1580 [Bacteroidota bacterium]|jgi:mono/diheme cytochrome c family protein
MKNILILASLTLILGSCGEKKEEQKDAGFEMNRSKKETPAAAQSKDGVPVDLSNKGIGPVSNVAFGAEIDQALAAQGEAKFNSICIACHQINQRMIGPALAGVYERRSPEWVMNMILNPDEMLKSDPIAKALYEEYNGAMMLNQNLSQEEARAVAEYLRSF